jgi:RNA-binding protein NOB1
MQNVSLHCGLRVLTTSAAFMIRRQQRYVLRCSSCFTVCADMSRAFCPSCGGHTLFRASVETNARGEDTYQWRQGFRQMSSKRGTRYAIPKMLGGRLGKIKDLRLREDVMPGRRHRDVKAAAAAALGVVASTDGGFDGLGASFGEVRNERRQEVVVGYGRRNPNVVRKR